MDVGFEAARTACPRFSVDHDSERRAGLEIKLVREPYTSHMTPKLAVSGRGWSPMYAHPRAKRVVDYYHNYEIERENKRRALVEQQRQQRVIQEQNEKRDRQIVTVILVIIGIFVIGIIVNGLVSLGRKWMPTGGSSGSYSYSGDSPDVPGAGGSGSGRSYVGGGFGNFPGRRGEFTIIKDVGSGGKVTWEGNFGATWDAEAEILESDINGPTKMQMGDRIFEKDPWTDEWKEK